MLAYTTVLEIAREAAETAEKSGTEPLSIVGFDPGTPDGFVRHIPFLGDYCPDGWQPAQDIDDLFVDSSGLGGSNEPALSVGQFIRELEEYHQSGINYGFGLSQAGQFQVYIRVYVRL